MASPDGFPWTTVARHYSSKTGAWNASAHLGIDSRVMKPSALVVGNDIYFQVSLNEVVILRYHIETNCLSAIHPPRTHVNIGDFGLLSMGDGLLGLAGIMGSRICMWSMKVNPEGIAGWVRRRDIEIVTGIPSIPCSKARVIASEDGMGIIFVVTYVGLFMVDLKSGRKRKVDDDGNYFSISPFMSFYTPGQAN
ncbi:hypothetical protein EJB05_14260, partial [Eragrostis curvula]